MTFIPKAQEIYRHFKGNLYQIVTLAEHTETGEVMVVYQALYGEFKIYTRPLEMFCSKVDRAKYPDVKQEYRFELQNEWGRKEAARSTEVVAESMTDPVPESVNTKEEPALDPMLLSFLDADTYEERLNILAGLHHRITDDMITTMAIASDVEIPEGNLEERYVQLKTCLLTLEKYESSRLR